MEKAETRALYMKDFAARIDALPERVRASIRAAHGELLETIAATPRTRWLPVAANVELTEAVYRATGRAEADDFFQGLQLGQFDTPTWRNFIQGALAVLGVDPGSLVKWLPRAVGLMFRNCGVWSVERQGETHVEVRISELPAVCAWSSEWHASVRAALTSIYVLTGRKGEVSIRETDGQAGRVCYQLRWQPE